ncbi:hypothetical protein [Actinoplanes solisilvae]|uniref:hypothetical protein n=1 Tax=Actinoplanes solisilvae TaxID=2486853 RepID=UPI000FDC396A|nr:hypothetical protein [Actinoplanes solisilvae]
MRIGRRRLGFALAILLLVSFSALSATAFVRWRAAGTAHDIAPPAGAVAQLSDGGRYETVVADRAHIIALGLRSDRGAPTVRTYALPPDSPWLQSRKIVATQLDHWEQVGSCADDRQARIVECAWREPTRWWPREVRLTMMRPPPATENRDGWPDATFLIIGSGRAA